MSLQKNDRWIASCLPLHPPNNNKKKHKIILQHKKWPQTLQHINIALNSCCVHNKLLETSGTASQQRESFADRIIIIMLLSLLHWLHVCVYNIHYTTVRSHYHGHMPNGTGVLSVRPILKKNVWGQLATPTNTQTPVF